MPAASVTNAPSRALRISLIVPLSGDGAASACPRAADALRGDTQVECPPVPAVFAQDGGESRTLLVSPSVAMNMAAQGAGGGIIAFMAPDLLPGEGWAEAVETFFAVHPEVEVAAGRTLVRPEGAFGLAEAVLESGAAVESAGTRGRPLSAEGAAAVHCAVRKAAFDRTGGLDEGLPPGVTVLRPLGGLLAARSAQVPVPDAMVAWRLASRSLGAFLSRQFCIGLADYYAPQQRALRDRVRRAASVPLRAARLAPDAWQVAALPALLLSGACARALGMLWGLVRGGKRARPLASPLVGPQSNFLICREDRPSRPAASVVVPVHREPEWFGLCLAALVRQDIEEPYEIIAVCDTPGEFPLWIGTAFPCVRVCFCEPGDGPGGARNRGMAAARGDYVAFTDDDCLAERGWLRAVVDACRRSGRPVTGWTDVADVSSPLARGLNYAEQGTARPRRPRYVRGAGGGNMCVPRALLQSSGACFAEGVYGAEEIALLQGLPAQALPVLMQPEAGVRHLRSGSLAAHMQRVFRLGKGSGRLRRSSGLRGSVFARRVYMSPLLLPLRLLLTTLRALRFSGVGVCDVLRLYPVLFCAYAVYAAGFAAGAAAASDTRHI